MASSEADRQDNWMVLVPGDPGQRTGGYGYVREVVAGLHALGQSVALQGLPGRFPKVDRVARQALDSVLASAPDGTTVVVDGLALGGCPEAAETHGNRLNLIALVHHPLADETGLGDADRRHFLATERRALAAVRRVVTTSETTASGLARYHVPPEKIAVVTPGVHAVEIGQARHRLLPDGLNLLCLAHLSPRKAQLDLVEALAALGAYNWCCDLAGSDRRDPAYAARVKARIDELGLGDRIRLRGELSGSALTQAFQQADLFVLPSLYEGYGMVIDEALAHGLPLVTTDGGALAVTADRPGCVRYPAGDVEALGALLEARLQDSDLLQRQQLQARQAASRLRSWETCALEFHQAVRDAPVKGSGFDADWLRLREPADHAARSRQLGAMAVDWLQARADGPLVVADIGAGTGSNWRYLSQAFPDPLRARCSWHLYDQDRRLLAECGANDASVHRHGQYLEAANLDQQLPARLHLLTAAALIDLVSRPWLEAFASTAASRQAAVLVVLSYAGRFRLTPALRADEALNERVNAHQHSDKGTGAACGPQATAVLTEALQARGYRVWSEASVWRLDQDQADLQVALMQGWVEAARALPEGLPGTAKGAADWLGDWLSERVAQAQRGELVIEVDHQDLFGAPPS